MRPNKIRLLFLLFIAIIPCGLVAQNTKFRIDDWEKRINKRQPPVMVLDAVGFKPGMIVGEVGAGTGRMTLWIADRISDSGKIYANDINTGNLEQLRTKAKESGFTNIEIITGDTRDPKLPKGKLDVAFMINVYHHLDDQQAMLKNILPSLKPGAYLAIVECDPDIVEWGDSEGCTSKKDMEAELKQAGFELIRTDDILDEDNIYIARPLILKK